MTATAVHPDETATRADHYYEPALPIAELHESPKNPRQHYDAAALKELAENLKAAGQITPVVVRPRPAGGYELAAGHRRTRAAKLAGLTTLQAIVRDMDEAEFVEVLNVENLQRDDLNALEEARGFRTLMTDAGYDVPKISGRVGRSVQYVYDRLKLLQLIPAAMNLLHEGTITPGHGILLSRLNRKDQERALGEVSRNGSDGGVLERESVSPEYFPDSELELKDPRKARSVRELKQWIDRNVRFVPDKVDQADLAFDLPKTAEILDTAAASKLKVIKITHEYRVPDQARDAKERTYGHHSWKRADGGPELLDDYGMALEKPKASKICDHAVVGLIVAGPGRGEAMMVCVAKEKCTVHWAKEMKERARRAKEREKEQGRGGSSRAPAMSEKARAKQEARDRQLRLEAEADELVTTRVREAVLAKVTAPLAPAVLVALVMDGYEILSNEEASALGELIGVKNPLRSPTKVATRLKAVDADTLARAVVSVSICDERNYGVPSPLEAIAQVYQVSQTEIRKQVLAELERKEQEAEEAAKSEKAAAAAAATEKKAKPKAKAGKASKSKKSQLLPFMKVMVPSPDLALIVGADPLTRTEVTQKVWTYIKRHGLQDKQNRRMINADALLRPIFRRDQVSMFDMTKALNNHLTPEKKGKAAKTPKAASKLACSSCGCTEDAACAGGCAWDQEALARGEHICTSCTNPGASDSGWASSGWPEDGNSVVLHGALPKKKGKAKKESRKVKG